MMSPEIDQTTLTAYTLGELDAVERARVEAFLEESAFGRGIVATVRRAGDRVTEELKGEATNTLTSLQRDELERRIAQTAWREPTARRAQQRWNRFVLAGSIAASTLIVGSLAVFLYSRIYREMASTPVGSPTVNQPSIIITQMVRPPQGLPDGNELAGSRPEGPRIDSPDDTPRWTGGASAPLPANPLANGGGNALAGAGVANPSFNDNPFRGAAEHPLSSFPAEVGNASYLNIRRTLSHGKLPPPQAVRAEELLNYFAWKSPPAALGGAITGEIELGDCPWNQQHRLARILLQTQAFSPGQRPPVNLVFLVDTSHSMSSDEKLPLITRCLRSLISQLQGRDRIAIVVAQNRRVLLPPTSGDRRTEIVDAIGRLHAGDAAAVGGGLDSAYSAAKANYLPAAVNRVVLITDGHWLDGAADSDAVPHRIQEGAAGGVPLSILAMSPAYLDDLSMRHLALAGRGTLSVIDTVTDAGKALIHLIDGSLIEAADNVRIAVKLDPKVVASYRLLGYESHSSGQVNSDAPPNSEIGAGRSVTAMYEMIPSPGAEGSPLSVRVLYRRPGQENDDSLDLAAPQTASPVAQTSDDFRFASAVAEFSMLLRSPGNAGSVSYSDAIGLAAQGLGPDEDQTRAEFIDLIRQARAAAGAAGN